jgi:UDP-N-acetylmuramoylalanine--D-glutamate ligase
MGFKGKRVLIIGGGVSGRGAESALKKEGAECVVFEDGTGRGMPDKTTGELPDGAGKELPGGTNKDFPEGEFDLVAVSPGVSREHYVFGYAKSKNIPVIGEIELGYLLHKGKTVAVTGTNGKTTTVALTGRILERAGLDVCVCGNIGVSFAECAANRPRDIAVVEVSSFQLETIDKFKPDIACILNISPDHLDRHKTLKNYALTKRRIAENQERGDYLILSQDDVPLFALEDFRPRSTVLYTSLRGRVSGAYLADGKIYFNGEYVCDRDGIRLEGDHNIADVLAAVCITKLLGVANNVIRSVLSEFTQAEHRMSYAGTVNGKNYYNDSKGTNAGATLAAIRATVGDTCLILGGDAKGCGFDGLFGAMPQTVKKIIVIGECAPLIRDSAFRFGYYELEFCDNLDAAVAAAARQNVDNVLFSPAAASFGMFRDYRERGEKFVEAVKKLKEGTLP